MINQKKKNIVNGIEDLDKESIHIREQRKIILSNVQKSTIGEVFFSKIS